MDGFFTEILFSFQKPAADTGLVVFFDRNVHTDQAECKQYIAKCAQYAAKYHVYLVSGLFFHQGNLCLCMFGPDGAPLCRQGALYLPADFANLLEPDTSISVVNTELSNFFLCVGCDITHPQVIRAAALKGAQVIVNVQNISFADDTNERLMYSVWEAAQSNEVYVIGITSNFYAVSCPALLTRSRNGYLVAKNTYVPTRFGLNTQKLMETRKQSGILAGLNRKLMENHQNELVNEL